MACFCNLGLSTTTATHTTDAGHHGGDFSSTCTGRGVSTSPCAVGAVCVSDARLPSQRPKAPLRGGSAVEFNVEVWVREAWYSYYISVPCPHTQPRSRAVAVLAGGGALSRGADATVSEILVKS